MIKYAGSLLALILFSLTGDAMDENPLREDEQETTKKITMSVNPEGVIKGKGEFFTARSIERKDVPAVIKVMQEKCAFKEGLPPSPRRASAFIHTLVDRQKQGNPYSALVMEENGALVAALGLGRMNVLDPDTLAVKGIMDAYAQLGVIGFMDPDAKDKYAQRNVRRVEVGNLDLLAVWPLVSGDNQKPDKPINSQKGLGALLPILPTSLGGEKIKEALEIGIEAFQVLKNSGRPLPVEGTIPTHVVGLFHPDDPLIPWLELVGFRLLRHDDFFAYHGSPRIMAYLELR